MKWFASLALVGVAGLSLWSDAQAYLDPGTGSAILQGILGALAALAITLKLYWHKLLRFFGLRKPARPEIDTPRDTDSARAGRGGVPGDRRGP